MCFDRDALPPDLPADLVVPRMAGGAAAEQLELTSADGARFSAALATSGEAHDPAVIILPDVRGLYRFYVELAERFAEAGHHAVAIDYFGRTADTGERPNDWDYWPHVRETSPETVQADVAAAIALLRERTGATSFVTVGFCFGGAQSFLAATHAELDLDAVVGFYGGLNGERLGIPSPRDTAAGAVRPVLALFGGADEGIPERDRETFAASLERAGVEHEIVVYPGAPHSFFDRRQDEFADASQDAWRRTLGFLDGVGARAHA
ncbi:MAG TPA: dienelactone hydrolase family protein [Baekduia sp.]|uniref:dienelactone hydrolase family protein n=1 Tax=Baekduia sp. TaxID=2600305 RepID=UPI002B7FF102|nr:dienelactone hydrolase family protein [Baekduia sp.]HMJ32301.1 dienelactone hydrolase family protein [Baekduia sp.]